MVNRAGGFSRGVKALRSTAACLLPARFKLAVSQGDDHPPTLQKPTPLTPKRPNLLASSARTSARTTKPWCAEHGAAKGPPVPERVKRHQGRSFSFRSLRRELGITPAVFVVVLGPHCARREGGCMMDFFDHDELSWFHQALSALWGYGI